MKFTPLILNPMFLSLYGSTGHTHAPNHVLDLDGSGDSELPAHVQKLALLSGVVQR